MDDRHLQETGAWLQENAGIAVPLRIRREELEERLAAHLEYLTERDFQQFVLLLYKVDVSEKKVKEILAVEQYPGVFRSIARLIIERQEEKIRSREQYRQPPETLPDDEEKW
ncbi:hypothetical protein ACWKWU_17060 [Chitinophaga lutea]